MFTRCCCALQTYTPRRCEHVSCKPQRPSSTASRPLEVSQSASYDTPAIASSILQPSKIALPEPSEPSNHPCIRPIGHMQASNRQPGSHGPFCDLPGARSLLKCPFPTRGTRPVSTEPYPARRIASQPGSQHCSSELGPNSARARQRNRYITLPCITTYTYVRHRIEKRNDDAAEQDLAASCGSQRPLRPATPRDETSSNNEVGRAHRPGQGRQHLPTE